ncbi:hypothetical protein Vadar_030724 [Vaccinium darrowii]|uniref:Uncharacterized protein n=1 Tax=Vaccinium darrowii TaxID=229202 RepID=A0ACB7Z1P3_9ERIC|nr:hypothetical protein Vadar_030724 [Vaccinium darrowii]
MADDYIEKFLVEKLKEVLDDLETKAHQHLPAKIAQLSSKFRNLKEIVEGRNRTTIDLREKLYTLKNLLSEWQMHLKKTKHTYSWKSLSFVLNFKQNLDQITEELRVQAQNTPPPEKTGQTTRLTGETLQTTPPTGDTDQGYRWSDRLVDEKKVYGIDDKALSLQKSLVLHNNSNDRRFSMIGIVGMRGVGKTTLAQVVFNKPEVKNHFLPRIWVCASKQPRDHSDHRYEIVKRMLECLGVEETTIKSVNDEHELKGLLFALRLQLTGKRYLIVLDDVWREEAQYQDFCSSLEKDENQCVEKLAYGLPKGYGGAVIVTSRSEEIVKKMVGENSHRVSPLKDPDCIWNIFIDSADENNTQLEVLKELKEKIIEKCAWLPLAAKMMGQIAREPPVQKKLAAVQEIPTAALPENLESDQQAKQPVQEKPAAVLPENLESDQLAKLPVQAKLSVQEKPVAVLPENLESDQQAKLPVQEKPAAVLPENLESDQPAKLPVQEKPVAVLPENLESDQPAKLPVQEKPAVVLPENLESDQPAKLPVQEKPAVVLSENLKSDQQAKLPFQEKPAAVLPENLDSDQPAKLPDQEKPAVVLPENLESDQQANSLNQHSQQVED